ncbi:MAG: helix-turn-helix transcriptional regulator, partial [Chloroflexota bacterium]
AMPFAAAGRSALTKLASGMASTPKDIAARLASQIRVIQVPGGPANHVTGVIQQALLESVAVDLSYRDRQDRETVRIVEPVGVVGTPSGWFLVGWCRLRQAPRFFRLDRINLVSLTPERITPRPLAEMLSDLPFELAEPVLM